ncbi:TetR/AcrR family transcriptional regulator [Bosea caraganae]|uniref:TetR/AcrR family transcriptional regulator n=1 Tax=Bosea caraganae TaxID=2763117 RepID=A0A370KXF9_9HYPH|nr:TetR/AcrR family transcriptional regulator [Bosea caraganae]RDJ19658.1 TetR/AcrR family transcriptional regulator [Bosea caraganae]RDJ24316.1 TetR/AcrR family transcriptional regulator [Bosea caraganae]
MSSPTSRRASIGAVRNPESDAAILEAARALLEERGYADFSLSEVARRAHASKPTLYRRWPNKAALIFELYKAGHSERLSAPLQGELIQDMTAIVLALWRFWRETPTGPALRGLIAEAQSEASAIETLRQIYSPSSPKMARARIEHAIALGELAPNFDTDSALMLIMAFNWSQLLTNQIDDEAAVAPVLKLIFTSHPR